MEELEYIKGLQGRWHITLGNWDNHDKLKTLCGTGISPNYRRMSLNTEARKNLCPKCKEKKGKNHSRG